MCETAPTKCADLVHSVPKAKKNDQRQMFDQDGKNKGWSERKALNENTPAHEKL